jgi:hypothetical protein
MAQLALTILIGSLLLISVLGRTRVIGTLAVAGFVLGSLATASLFVLLN